MSAPHRIEKPDKKAFFSGLHGAITAVAALTTALVAVVGLALNQGWLNGGSKTGGNAGAGTGTGTGTTASTEVTPQYVVDPTSLTFQALGATTVSVDVSNIGVVPLTVEPPTVTGPDRSHFVAHHDGCQGSVEPGRSCQLQVTFKQAPGTFNAILVVQVTGAVSATEVPITATAIL